MVALSVAGCSNHLALDSDDEPFAVYLDMNHCYALGRASAGEPERPSDPEVLERLRMLRRDGRVVVPLSAIHYSELRENPRDRFTAEAGAVMEELSDFWTLAADEHGVRRRVRRSAEGALGPTGGRTDLPEDRTRGRLRPRHARLLWA